MQPGSDVIILGSGLAGCTAGLCLARQGLRVLIVDQGTHPRFALGESTTTPASLWLRFMARRYGAPELLNIASSLALQQNVAPTSGIKDNFGFLYHRPGSARPERSWQAVLPHASFSEASRDQADAHSEMHYFRQDVDAYLWAMALAAGAQGRSATKTVDVEFDDDGVTLLTDRGERLRAGFLVDASGHRSVLADKLGLRERPTTMRTNARTMFTHMVGVENYEDLGLVEPTMSPWSRGTLHHIFAGGWMWVIPFGNHPGSKNPLCSVGLSLDNRHSPPTQQPPAEAWCSFLEQYPSIAPQFAHATAVRPWVHTDRVQYSSRQCVGPRYWMTSHAAGTVDALYSFGNINTFQTVACGVDLVVRAFRDGDFDPARFAPLQRLTDNLLRFQDRIVYGNYVAMRDPRLLQTWIALWALTDTARIRQVLPAIVRHARTGDLCHLDKCLETPDEILTGFGQNTGLATTRTVLDLLDHWCDIMQEFEAGGATADATIARLETAVRSDPRHGIDLATMGLILAELPRRYRALREHGLRLYSASFLTIPEMDGLGVDESP
ncbi:MAG TPA: FAD-dependent oxidoreductase [Planctomycetota bacterium]|nr:FAD-dependent oxidoreductase [Planctomycetota bacterium]